MTIYFALLRGINVGQHKRIKMAELKNLLESMGLKQVKTYIQSGNVLFESEDESKILRERLETEIEKTFGFVVPVVLRTENEWEEMLANCPYQTESWPEGESLHVSFLMDAPSQEEVNQVHACKDEKDECQIIGKEAYLYLRQSILDSKLAVQLSKLKVPGTVRNWKTVNKLDGLLKTMAK